MRRTAIAAVLLASVVPTAAQSPAQQPALAPEQAIQLFAEAGFRLVDGTPVNRCGKPSNPRVAFIDLNGDGRAEAHIADVDPACYGKPGAYFAIMAQQADGSWRRLIAEDGIVGFQPARTAGWNDLSLEARDSACPGVRRFNGSDYGATACGSSAAAVFAAGSPAKPSATADARSAGAPLTGSRTQQIAQLFRNIVGATRTREWDAAVAAFPGARWEQRTTHAPNWLGSTRTQSGTIAIGGARYGVNLSGTSTRINEILFDSPGDDLVDWATIEAAIRALGMEARNIGCHSPTGFGWVRLTADGHSAVLHKSVNYGTAVASTDIYAFLLDDPFDGRTEAQVAADRSLC
jgi:hypothetical protein